MRVNSGVHLINFEKQTDHSAISQPRGHFINDWLYCSFLLSKKTTIQLDSGNELTFDLEKDKFYLLIALGNTLDCKPIRLFHSLSILLSNWKSLVLFLTRLDRGNHAGIGYHDLGKTVSPEKYNLMVFGVSGDQIMKTFRRRSYFCLSCVNL